ncbi:disulfide bond formation protein B, partial [Trabulsiella odontotermitis]|uniref:disulfide bond formation protein B n=1 Tax=Trabulsiella odontotermitis TaxID=379893 RepID=UPI000F6155D9
MKDFNVNNSTEDKKILTVLLSTYLLGMIAVIAAILTSAMVLQYIDGEIPCQLCLLQRIAMFGVCFGIILQFRHGFTYSNTGLSMIFSLFLLIVSVRQTLNDIYPRPGHEYIGSLVFG